LPLFLLVYFSVRKELRNLTLLLASLLFYFWGEGRYVVVMLLYMVFNWAFGLLIERARKKHQTRAKIVFIAALVFNLGFLLFYKYFNFFVDQLNSLIIHWHPIIQVSKVHLPIGISFFTFQAVSYVIDVYRRDVKAQRNLIDFSMYKALFPQLIAGPIVRYRDVASQINSRQVNFAHFSIGVERFIVGLTKKLLIANTVALVADKVFETPPHLLTFEMAWLGIVCYALQIYFDFSGYSDMAIGLGKMLGFDFLENFNYPYISRSIKEFWRRWHISLSSWFRDYLYIPLGGNKGGKYRTYFNLFSVFVLCGLWHGASWVFIAWGVWHGLFLVLERTLFGKWMQKWPVALRYSYAMLVILIGWVFFRSSTLSEAAHYIKSMAGVNGFGFQPAMQLLHIKTILAIAVGIVFMTPVYGRLKMPKFLTTRAYRRSRKVYRIGFTALLFLLLFACCMILSTDTYNPFIYFRF
jgi:alginate O-acetyltransferase complex protein AlgI